MIDKKAAGPARVRTLFLVPWLTGCGPGDGAPYPTCHVWSRQGHVETFTFWAVPWQEAEGFIIVGPPLRNQRSVAEYVAGDGRTWAYLPDKVGDPEGDLLPGPGALIAGPEPMALQPGWGPGEFSLYLYYKRPTTNPQREGNHIWSLTPFPHHAWLGSACPGDTWSDVPPFDASGQVAMTYGVRATRPAPERRRGAVRTHQDGVPEP